MLSCPLCPPQNTEANDLIFCLYLDPLSGGKPCFLAWVPWFPPPVVSWHLLPSQNANISFGSTFLADQLAVSFFEKIQAITRELPQSPMSASTHLSTGSVSLLVPAGKPPLLLSEDITLPCAHPPSLSCSNHPSPSHVINSPLSARLFPAVWKHRRLSSLTTVPIHSIASFSQSLIFLLSFSEPPLRTVQANGLHFDLELLQPFFSTLLSIALCWSHSVISPVNSLQLLPVTS